MTVLMLLLTCCRSTQIKTNDRPVFNWMDVPKVFKEDGEPLIMYNRETHSVSMDENKWYEIVEYIITTEENKKALEAYFNYE